MSEMLRGDNRVYAFIRDDQKIVEMDASTAKKLYEYYNKYVDLMKEKKMGLRNTVKKLLTGQSLEWHLPHTLKPGEALARCNKCSGVFVIAKSEQRVPYYCWGCK